MSTRQEGVKTNPCHVAQVIWFGLSNPNESAGLGDRFKGIAAAFWLVPPHFESLVLPRLHGGNAAL